MDAKSTNNKKNSYSVVAMKYDKVKKPFGLFRAL